MSILPKGNQCRVNAPVVWGQDFQEAQLYRKLQPGDLTDHNFDAARPIRTGDLFKVFLKPADVEKFIRMMELQ